MVEPEHKWEHMNAGDYCPLIKDVCRKTLCQWWVTKPSYDGKYSRRSMCAIVLIAESR